MDDQQTQSDAPRPIDARSGEPSSPASATQSDAENTVASPGDALRHHRVGSTEPQLQDQDTRSVENFDLDDTPLTTDEALQLLHAAGIRIEKRTIQSYCKSFQEADFKRSHGLVCVKVSTMTGQEWHVSKRSLEQSSMMQRIPTHGNADATPSDAVMPAQQPVPPQTLAPQPNAVATLSDALRHPATDQWDIFEHPYVKRLENEVSHYKMELKDQVLRTEKIQSDALEKVVELQRMVTVGQSEVLANAFMKARGELVAPKAADSREAT